jgi:hypothetical protein
MKRSRYGNQAYPLEEMLRMGSALLEKTKKENVVYLELIVRQKMIDYYWVYRQDYAFAFEQYAVQEKRLQTVLSEEIPEKSNLQPYAPRRPIDPNLRSHEQIIFQMDSFKLTETVLSDLY